MEEGIDKSKIFNRFFLKLPIKRSRMYKTMPVWVRDYNDRVEHMKRRELAEKLAERTNLQKSEVHLLLRALADEVWVALSDNKVFRLPGVGRIFIKYTMRKRNYLHKYQRYTHFPIVNIQAAFHLNKKLKEEMAVLIEDAAERVLEANIDYNQDRIKKVFGNKENMEKYYDGSNIIDDE